MDTYGGRYGCLNGIDLDMWSRASCVGGGEGKVR